MKRSNFVLIGILLLGATILPNMYIKHTTAQSNETAVVTLVVGEYRLDIVRVWNTGKAGYERPDQDTFLILETILHNDADTETIFYGKDFPATIEGNSYEVQNMKEVRDEFYSGRDYPGNNNGQKVVAHNSDLSLLVYDLPKDFTSITLEFNPNGNHTQVTLQLTPTGDNGNYIVTPMQNSEYIIMLSTFTPTFTPTNTPTPTITFTPSITPTPMGGSGVTIVTGDGYRLGIARIWETQKASDTKSKHGVFLVLDVTLYNDTGSEYCFKDDDFKAEINGESRSPDNLQEVRDEFFPGRDYPGGFLGQCVSKKNSEQSLLEYDTSNGFSSIIIKFAPDNHETRFALWLERKTASEYDFGIKWVEQGIAQLLTFTPSPSPLPTDTPTQTLTATITFTPSLTYTPSLTFTPSQTPAASNTPRPHPVSTSTLTPRPPQKRYVAVQSVNIRSCPGTACQIIGQLSFGDALNITGEKTVDGEIWYRFTRGNQGAWIAGWLTSTEQPYTVPVVDQPVATQPPEQPQQPAAVQPTLPLAPVQPTQPSVVVPPVSGAAAPCLVDFDFSVCPLYSPAPKNCAEVVARGIPERVAACCWPARDADKDGLACYGT